jgi:IS5 family transposase
MSERQVGQLSFVDGFVGATAPGNAVLERILALVNWGEIEVLLSPLHAGRMGAPAYPSIVLFRALLLQQWFALSDPALEEAMGDRLSFRRFLGLALSEKVPDHSTVWRFRERLAQGGLAARAFALIEQQIDKAGFVLKRGTLIDATLIPSAVNAPEPPDGPQPLDKDGRPASKLVKSPLDPDAAWTRSAKGEKYRFGYKAHVALDKGSRIVRRVVFTPANINDSLCGDSLICGDERILYADKGYDSNARRALLKDKGIRDGIMRRSNRWWPMSPWMIKRNKIIVTRRAPIEPLFALLKHVYGLARARYRGLARNAASVHLAFTAMNLKRWAVLKNAA